MNKILQALVFLLGFATASWGQSLVIVAETGPRAARLNLVMLSEGYTAAELAANKFKNDATMISNALLNTEPFKSYRPFFNAYGIAIASNQSGADQGSLGASRDTYFNAAFYDPPLDRLLTINSTGYSRVTSLLNTFVPEYDIVLVIVNDTKYGGSGGSYAVTSTNSSAAEIAIHEIGHSFAGLGDEYAYAGSSSSETPNTTRQTQRALIKWNHWINSTTPIATPETSTYGNGLVGLFEGAAYQETGWYRPTLDSKMNNLGVPFYAVNEEAIILSIYNRVSVITSASPASANVTVSQPNQTLTFTVDGPSTAATAPAITVEWRLDGNVIAGQVGRTLTRLSTLVGNGSHTLIATAVDPTTKVRKDTSGLLSDTRTWTLNLSNQGPAAPTSLTATAKADGKVDLAWTDNASDEGGYAIDRAIGTGAFTEIGRVGINATAYTDSTATAGSSTKYRVKGVNAADSAIFGNLSNTVTVTPEISPSPLSEPSNVAVVRGQSATFAVQAAGVPLRYQWRFKGNTISGATKSTYSISSAQPANDGAYDCIVSNDVGSYTSATATLTVNLMPELTLHPLSQTVLYDQAVTLSVQAAGTATLLFQWRKNNIDIPGATGSTLTLALPNVADAGSYTCYVSNAFGNITSKAAVLTVLGPPVIKTQPVSATITRGTSTTFSLTAVGSGTLTYQWRKGGTAITGATKSSLLLASVADSALGSYDCVVSNSYGSTISASASLSFLSATTGDYRLAGDRAGTAKWRWVKRFGGAVRDTATALAVAPGGSIYFGGLSQSPGIKLDALNASNLGAYIGWLDSSGKALAIEALNTGTTDRGTVSVGPSFMQYIAAAQTSTVNPGLVAYFQFGGIPSGTFVTTYRYGDSNYADLVPEAAVDGSASMFIGGSHPTTHRPMLRKVDNLLVPIGAPAQWTRTVTSIGAADAVLAVLRLPSGKIIVAGTAEYDGAGSISFENGSDPGGAPLGGGSVTLPPVVLSGVANSQTGFIACYHDSGEVQWVKGYAQELRSLAVDVGGALWTAGTDTGSVAVLLKINAADGTNDARFPVTGADGLSVATCTGGDVALLARTSSAPVTVQGYSLNRSGYAVIKFSPTGTLRWVLPAFGSYGDAFGSKRARLASGEDGQLYAALTLEGDGNAEFAGVTPFSMKARQSDAFIAAISEVPLVVTPPAPQIVQLGQPLNLSVTAGGLAGTIKYQWLKDGKLLTGKTSSTLNIAVTKLTDAGFYSCKVTGNGGSVESVKAPVNIVDTTPRTLKAPLTKPLDLPVSGSGTGLSYTWWKHGVRVFNVGGFTNTTTSKMRIAAMSSLYADDYVCKVTGAGGTLDVPFAVAVLSAPTLTLPSIPASIVSGAFDLQLSATDAASFKISNLPPGLIYNATTGRITGKPTVMGAKLVTVSATNAAGPSSVLTFTINVIDLLAQLKGTHQGLLSGARPWLNDLDGLLTLSVSGTGTVTGSLRTALASYSLTGSVDADPATQTWTFKQFVTRSGKPRLVLTVNSALASDQSFVGTLIEEPTPGDVANINGHRVTWSASTPATAHAGTYTGTLQASAGSSGTPSLAPGTFKSIITAATGVCGWSGKLGDGTSVSGSTYLSPTAQVPVWQALYSNQGQILGRTTVANPTLTGTLQWKRKQVGTSALWWSDAPVSVNCSKAP